MHNDLKHQVYLGGWALRVSTISCRSGELNLWLSSYMCFRTETDTQS